MLTAFFSVAEHLYRLSILGISEHLHQWSQLSNPMAMLTAFFSVAEHLYRLSILGILCFPQKLDPDASASDAKSLFHWLRGRCMPMKRMMRIQFL